MSLQFVIGGSRSDKTKKVHEQMVLEAESNPTIHYVMLVPEQFTLENQKNLTSLSTRGALFNIDILSFARLAYRVFQELAKEMPRVLDDTGKNLILRKILEEKKEELPLLGSKAKKIGFVAEVKSSISEFLQYDITGKTLLAMARTSEKRPNLYRKLKELSEVYKEFLKCLGEDEITSEELLDLLCKAIKDSKSIPNTEFVLDGFTGFTPIQYRVIEQLLLHAKKVTIVLTMEPEDMKESSIAPHELFYMSGQVKNKLLEITKRHAILVEEDRIMESQGEEEDLDFLAKHIFRYGEQASKGDCKQISIHVAASPEREAHFVANTILKYVRSNEGYRYRDFAVVTGDLDAYYRDFTQVFQKENIPAFIDHKEKILHSFLVNGILALIEMVRYDFSYESVFRYLRCGFEEDLESGDIDLLENYILAFGVRGKSMYGKEFTYGEKVFTESELGDIDTYRECFFESVDEITQELSKKQPVKKWLEAIVLHLIRLKVPQKLDQMAETFRDNGDFGLDKEYSQIYGTLLDLFDQLALLAGDEYMKLGEFEDILTSGFEECKIGTLPLTQDQVVVGDLTRTRLGEVKVLFVVGANEGVIPKKKESIGILSESDRIFLEENEFELADTARKDAFVQKYYLYRILTQPKNRLFVSYASGTNGGDKKSPSYLISLLKGLFPSLEEDFIKEGLEGITSKADAREYLAKMLCEKAGETEINLSDPSFNTLYRELFFRKEEKEHVKSLVESAYYYNQPMPLDESLAKRLFHAEDSKVTELERFAECYYKHFLTYGLQLAERQEYTISPKDTGNMFHDALDYITELIQKKKLGLDSLNLDVQSELVEEAMKQVTENYQETALYASRRNEFIIKRMTRILKKTLWVLLKQEEAGSYHVAYHEKKTKNGRIDRVDFFEEDEDLYVKVIDYKSGSKEFSLTDTFYGLQLQLVLYLADTIELESRSQKKKVLPGGMFYYRIQDPFVAEEEREDEKKYLRNFKLSGLVNDNEKNLKALDKEMSPGVSSSIIPIKKNKDEKFDRFSMNASQKQFQDLIDYVKWKTENMREEINQGKIDLNPYSNGNNKNACDYCHYRGICQFDPRYNKYRILENMKNEEFWDKISQQLKKEEGE